MFKCENCKTVFDIEEAVVETEEHGECFGFPYYVDILCCPNCRSDDLACGIDEEDYYNE